MIEIEADNYKRIFLDKGETTAEEYSFLAKGGFLVEEKYDELAIIRNRLFSSRYSTDKLGLTIAPTLDCNFRCEYCYEKDSRKKGIMPIDVQNKIIESTEKRIKNISELNVTWYGGEPLLALPVIINVSDGLRRISRENDVKYSASIISNGYLLTETVAQTLVEHGIVSCQITLDGDKRTHDSRRYLDGKLPTFEKIVNNIVIASKIIPQIIVRVNIDKDNADAAITIKGILDEFLCNNVIVYPSPIKNKHGCYDRETCFTNKEFVEAEWQYTSTLNDREQKDNILSKYPKIRGNICCADSASSIIISPNGDIYKCWSDIGNTATCCGNIVDETTNIMNILKYLDYDCTRDEQCRECKFLPICMGDCPYERINQANSRCMFFDSFHGQLLKKVADIINSKSNV